MTITLPDGALAAAIAAIAGAIVWAIRLVTNTHVETLREQAAAAKEMLPLVRNMDQMLAEHLELEQRHGSELARIRKAIKRVAPMAFICEDCHQWFGEEGDKPEHLSMCRCSDPSEVTITGQHRAVTASGRTSVNTPVKGMPATPRRPTRSKPG